MTRHLHLTDLEVEELLGAYALDACEPVEIAAIDAVLARRPDLARVAMQLGEAASWFGAAEALEPPVELRADVLEAARARRSGAVDAALELYSSQSERLADAIAALPDEMLEIETPNGLSARDLVIHMAAQESLLAHLLGVPTVPDLDEVDIVARTEALIPRFAGRDVDDAISLWRASVEANRTWARRHGASTADWPGLQLSRDDTLVVRAFETWTHTDDLRGVLGLGSEPPDPRSLSLMSDLAGRMLPSALSLAGRRRDGKTARLVLTGPGGGDWTIAMGRGEPAAVPDVTLIADVVDWCRVVGDRLAASELVCVIEGDTELGDDLLAAGPALATL